MIDDDNDGLDDGDDDDDDKIDDEFESEGDVNNNKVIKHIENNMIFVFCNTNKDNK